MKILFTGGGTGGHLFPNLAIIDELIKETKGLVEILYLGSSDGLEAKIIPAQGINFQAIAVGKWRRYLSFKNLTDGLKILKGIWQSIKIIRKFKPQVVFSKGGFVSLPVAVAAWLQKVPVITHESDVTSGMANRIIFKLAQVICISWTATQKTLLLTTRAQGKPLKKQVVHTGIPVRRGLNQGSQKAGYTLTGFDSNLPVLLVIGGSQGAAYLNELIKNSIGKLVKFCQVVHVMGKQVANSKEQIAKSKWQRTNGKEQMVNSKFKILDSKFFRNYKQFEFLNERELADIFAITTLVVSRAGATALAEFAYVGLPVLLIPLDLDQSRGDQIENAEILAQSSVAVMSREQELNPENFARTVQELLRSPVQLLKFKKNLQNFFPPDADKKIVELILEVGLSEQS